MLRNGKRNVYMFLLYLVINKTRPGTHAEIYGPTLKMEFPHLRFSTLTTGCLVQISSLQFTYVQELAVLTYVESESFGAVVRYKLYQSMPRWSKSYPVKSGVNPGTVNAGNTALICSAYPNKSIRVGSHYTCSRPANML